MTPARLFWVALVVALIVYNITHANELPLIDWDK